jgi:hypothetical protein
MVSELGYIKSATCYATYNLKYLFLGYLSPLFTNPVGNRVYYLESYELSQFIESLDSCG